MANQQPKGGGAGGGGGRWGSFFTQAVAGMEAQLDSMLAEGEGSPATGRLPKKENDPPSRQPTPSNAVTTNASKAKPVPAAPRTSSSSRTNDRLQERLAKAMAAKKANTNPPSEPSSARASVDAASATAAAESASPRQSEDASSIRSRSSTPANAPPRAASPMRMGPKPELTPEPAANTPAVATEDPAKEDVKVPEESQKDGVVLAETASPAPEPPVTRSSLENGRDSPLPATDAAPTPIASQVVDADAQEELHRYIEQVDALQAKLQYLSKEASEAARKAVADAPAGTAERKLAEKDEKIALLMEEGRSMATNEQKLRTIIKKLRAQATENEKATAELRSSHDKTLKELDAVRSRTSRLEELEKEQTESQKQLSRTRAELESVRSDVSIKDTTIQSLKTDLQKAHDSNDSAASAKAKNALAAEQKKTKELEDTIASLQVEKNLVTERAKKSVADLNEKADRAAERSRVAEMELKGEIQAMEGKLEAMRALAEEASSGAVGDSQAKLLRQIETLQTQHAFASENWQGIEATLLARVANLEKERDEALKRESEMRKKARETTMRCKRQEEEIENLTSKLPDHEKDMASLQGEIEALRKRAEAAEAALAQAKADFEKQQTAWRTERNDQPDRRLWLDDVYSSRNQSRPDSPLLAVPTRTFSSDLVSLQAPPSKGRKISTPGSANDGFPDSASPIRRLSSQPPTRPPILSPHFGLSSAASMASFEPPHESLQTPMSRRSERDDDFEGIETASSPRQVVQDMVSVSTVGAGPSVQLVERMSAAIRRLEGEKVASKEELSRISAQRDEARAEIVALMKETDSRKAASGRVDELEAEVAAINARYQTTLELLGEKSEEVEELKADVQDVKAMYRELVERTVKG